MGRAAVVCDQNIREIIKGEKFAQGCFSRGAESSFGADRFGDICRLRGFCGSAGEGDENIRAQLENPLGQGNIIGIRPTPQGEQVARIGVQ